MWEHVLVKFDWVKHAGTLEQLRQDIQWQITNYAENDG
jgi:hypothetical protein